jgi:hypothetical protein
MRIAQESNGYSFRIVKRRLNQFEPVTGVPLRLRRLSTAATQAFERRARMLWLLFGLLVAAPAAGAQKNLKNDAKLSGTVVDKATGEPVAKVEIIFSANSRSVLSDSAGRYVFDSLPSGVVRFMIRAAGYPVTPLVVALVHGEHMARDVALDSSSTGVAVAQRLPGVSIAAAQPINRRLVDFERRRVTGQGQYLTREEIDKEKYNNLQDAMRNMRGVEVHCGGGSGCFIRMTRAPMSCNPEYIVDERVDPNFGPTIPIRDIEAVEVYTGASDVPGEFAGRNAGCGVIVIWTKAGPARKKPPTE